MKLHDAMILTAWCALMSLEQGAQAGDMPKTVCGQTRAGLSPTPPATTKKGNLDLLIIGGEAVPATKTYPWQVAIFQKALYGNSKTQMCGGGIIDKRWIVTAAHCFKPRGLPRPEESAFDIRLGKHSLYTEGEVGEQVIDNLKIYLHPQYNPDNSENDIALINTPRDIVFSRTVGPICLPENDVTPGENILATGWGMTENKKKSGSALKQVTIPVISLNECKKQYAVDRVTITDSMLCAGTAAGGVGTCQGDSGGPIAFRRADKMYELQGVVSFGPMAGCAAKGFSSVFTRVTSYMNWITQVTGRTAKDRNY